ncbi:MAG: 50S ribosomal protein L24 [Patescibacteria group bacterium]
MKVRIGDNILVVAGKYRGKTGEVRHVNEKRNAVVVEKINIRTKHIKKQADRPGQRIQFEAPFNASNVMVICPNCKKTTRVGFLRLENAKKQRVCKKCSQGLDKKFEKKKESKKAKK